MVPNNEGQESETEDGVGLKGTPGDFDRQILFWGFFDKKNWLFEIVETLPESETTRHRNFSRQCQGRHTGWDRSLTLILRNRVPVVPLNVHTIIPGCAPCLLFPPKFHASLPNVRSSGAKFGYKDEFRLFSKETDKHLPNWCCYRRVDRVEL